MATNMKFHAIAIGIISTVIIVLFLLMGPKPSDEHPQHKPTDRYARIGSATWGLSCNQQIEQARSYSDSTPLAKDKDGKVIQGTTWKTVTANNVLDVVKKACEGQLTCQIQASDDALGVPLPAGCYKQLNVNYRCAENDRLAFANIDQGQQLQIDCTAPDASAAAPHTP